MLPYGLAALYMLRIEAGLLLLGKDFDSSRFAFNDAHRSTPLELGWAWMFKGLAEDDRAFIGRRALEREIAEKASRWRMSGLVVDWQDYERVYGEAGLIPPKAHAPVHEDWMVYDDEGKRVGYATSFMYSPILQRHIAMARVRPDLATGRESRVPRVHRGPSLPEGRRPRGAPPPLQPRAEDGMTETYDAIVIGGGHNGLVNGAYLARGGLKTLILEQRHLVGGAAITEELRPGFWFTTFSYALSLLRPQIVQELELTKHGFMPLLMSSRFAPTPEGEYLWFTQDHDANLREIARISPHDADAYEQYGHDMDRVCQVLKPFLDAVPPDPFSDDPEELRGPGRARVAGFRKLDKRTFHNAVRLLTGSAADFLDDYFESDLLKGWLASSGIIGSKVGPRSQGSGLVLLFHSLGEHDGSFGTWAFHKGGNGGFTQVLARAAQAYRSRDPARVGGGPGADR